jgi:2-phosphoglycerate kinase
MLLIGGVSGTGKSTVAEDIGRSLGVPWFQVDDLRLAFQRSRVQTSDGSDALYYFADIDHKPDLWQRDPEELRDALISIAEILSPGLEAIIENHVGQHQRIIIEGDGIAPFLLDRQSIQHHVRAGQLRSVFLLENDEEALFSNMFARGRGAEYITETDLRAEARVKMLFGQWITSECDLYGLPILETRPWDTLISRINSAISSLLRSLFHRVKDHKFPSDAIRRSTADRAHPGLRGQSGLRRTQEDIASSQPVC